MKYLFYSLLLLAGLSCKSKAKLTAASPCEKFKTGTFTSFATSVGVSYKIERTDSIQKEISPDEAFEHRIAWLSPCKYQLFPDTTDELDMFAGIITVELYNLRGDTCDYKASSSNSELPDLYGFFVKVK